MGLVCNSSSYRYAYTHIELTITAWTLELTLKQTISELCVITKPGQLSHSTKKKKIYFVFSSNIGCIHIINLNELHKFSRFICTVSYFSMKPWIMIQYIVLMKEDYYVLYELTVPFMSAVNKIEGTCIVPSLF